jgi:glycosyltransferase involved in cell wall biosynthesis
MGLPTVAFDTPISREYLGGLGTYAAPVGDSAALADAIGGLLEAPDQFPNIGQLLRERAGRHFSWDRAGRHLLKVYRMALQRT